MQNADLGHFHLSKTDTTAATLPDHHHAGRLHLPQGLIMPYQLFDYTPDSVIHTMGEGWRYDPNKSPEENRDEKFKYLSADREAGTPGSGNVDGGRVR